MKKIITKRDIRNQIDQQMDDYLSQGGKVERIEQGISGREGASGPLKNSSFAFDQPKQERTYVPEVVAALDERKKSRAAPKPKTKSRPRKKIIYDDFGEPIRWEWVEE